MCVCVHINTCVHMCMKMHMYNDNQKCFLNMFREGTEEKRLEALLGELKERVNYFLFTGTIKSNLGLYNNLYIFQSD